MEDHLLVTSVFDLVECIKQQSQVAITKIEELICLNYKLIVSPFKFNLMSNKSLKNNISHVTNLSLIDIDPEIIFKLIKSSIISHSSFFKSIRFWLYT